MRALPNVEIVSLLLLLYTLFLGRKVFYIVYAFVLLEGFLYGFGIWWFSYLYVWSIWVTVVYLLLQNTSALFWSILSGLFGLLFGGLCALPYLLIGGAGAAFSYWFPVCSLTWFTAPETLHCVLRSFTRCAV